MISNGTVNKVELIGHLGADPESRYTANGAAVANFRVATNRQWKDADGEQRKETEWTPVVVWNKLAETCNQFLRKGSRVRVEGYLRTRSYEKDGVTHYRTEVVAESVLFLDRRDSGDQAEPEAAGEEDSAA